MQIRPTIAYMISCTDSKTARKLLFNYGYTLHAYCMLTYRKRKQKLYMIQHYTTNMHTGPRQILIGDHRRPLSGS